MSETKNNTMLQQISDVAWLVHHGEHNLGILNKDVQEHFTYITGTELVNFDDQMQVTSHFGNIKLFEEQIEAPVKMNETFYIKGYPVKYTNPVIVESDDPAYRADIPLYTKIRGNTVYYAAGYYCINFEKSWKSIHSPKLSTMVKYGYEGPFKTDAEVKRRTIELNRARKNAES